MSFHDLPAAMPREPELRQRLEQALAAKGSDYRPRTENLEANGGPRFVNRLILEDSPYLIQHAHNPVDWYPWGEEAFARARSEGKPVFLSIGYSTCHWCHVMERESFDNVEIARLMNERFISIKVDREQRPDIDNLYMTAVQITGKRGGWPLSSFLTPEAKPFFGATYFPPESFEQVLTQIADAWRDRRQEVESSAAQISLLVAQAVATGGEAVEVGDNALHAATSNLRERFDSELGGFGSAPKFPHESELLLLEQLFERWSAWPATNQKDTSATSATSAAQSLAELRVMIEVTLRAMAQGGLYDQVGGGFHRYSTDDRFLVPHFEKMLYNQAQLARVYLGAHRLFRDPLYERVARQTLDYLLREMRAESGLFYSATDADSKTPSGEDEEGAFFVWSPDQIRAALTSSDAELAIEVFGVTAEGNFEGHTILSLSRSLEETADQRGLDRVALVVRVDRIREALREARARRPPPLRDDKILTSWNGMVITALAEAADGLEDSRYRGAAIAAAESLWNDARRDPSGVSPGRLWRVSLDGQSSIEGLLDDSAYLSEGLLAVYDLTADRIWLERAVEVAEGMHEQFWDDDAGGFFSSPSGGDPLLLARPKDLADGAIPAGSSVAVRVLARLFARTGDLRYRQWAEQTVTASSAQISRYPASFSYLLAGYDDLRNGEVGGRKYAGGGAVRVSARRSSSSESSPAVSSPAGRLPTVPSLTGRWLVDLAMAEGWHVNASEPLSEDLIPTTIGLRTDSGWRLVEVSFPQARRVRLGERRDAAGASREEGEAAIYTGRATITVDLEATASPPEVTSEGALPPVIPLWVELQPCNEQICLSPERVRLDLAIDASATGPAEREEGVR